MNLRKPIIVYCHDLSNYTWSLNRQPANSQSIEAFVRDCKGAYAPYLAGAWDRLLMKGLIKRERFMSVVFVANLGSAL